MQILFYIILHVYLHYTLFLSRQPASRPVIAVKKKKVQGEVFRCLHLPSQ